MMKKGMGTLVCLALMAAVWSWAATSYTVQTKLANTGGTLTARGVLQSTVGTVYRTYTTALPVPMSVSSITGYRISALTRNGVSVPVLGAYTTNYSTSFTKSSGSSQSLTATFTAVPGPPPPATVTWQMQTEINSASGKISTLRDGIVTDLTTPNLLATKNYTDTVGAAKPVSVTVTADTGYSIGSLATTGTVASNDGSTASITGIPVTGLSVNYVTVNFVKQSLLVTTSSAGISPVNPQVVYGGSVVLTATPTGTSNVVNSFTMTGTAIAALTDSYGYPVTLPHKGPVTATISNIYTPLSVSATYSSDTYSAMWTDCSVACHSIAANPNVRATFGLWSASTHRRAGQDCVTCHNTMPGGVVRESVDATTFQVIGTSAGTIGDVYCVRCHNPSIATDFAGSKHKANAMICTTCHVQGAHNPDPVVSICNSCHVDGQGNVAGHPFQVPAGQVCIACHNPHSAVTALTTAQVAAHFNNLTGAGYPASYMTSRSNCTNCHFDDSATGNKNAVNRHAWAQSAHARVADPAWSGDDFKTKSGCVQCHSTTGFIAYSTGKITAAWGVASDKSKELLTCIGCHSDVPTGTVRRVPALRPFADDNYRNRDVGSSNLCFNCHSGPNNGNSIQVKVGTADFTNLPFIAPHYMGAGGNLHGKAGYHFPGQVYAFYSSNTHRTIGLGNQANTGTAGPCVSCHMSQPTDKHLYQAVSKDNNGGITGITSTACVNCHGSYLDGPVMSGAKTGFANALTVLNAMLADKGFVYTGSAPYFSNTNWGVGQAGANAMGAAYNYQLLISEPGAYVHNSAYAKKLITDSIDSLFNGTVTGSIDTAVSYLVTQGAITADVAAGITSYKSKDVCTTCHGGTAATAAPMAVFGHPAHLTASYGPGVYFGSDVSSCQNCHVYGASTHMNGTVNLIPSGCNGCHPGGAPNWGASGRIDCVTCHAAVPSTLSNGVKAPYKAKFLSSGHGQFAGSNQCTVCHDPDSRHITGTIGDGVRLRLFNDNNLCASCHNDPAVVRTAYLNMNTHVSLNCRDCHDPHGTANPSMLRDTINGVTISIADLDSGLVDTATNLGFCQGCHTATVHYRAGVPENEHYTSGCLGCHSHNSAGGAFKPVGGSCNSCHGYPPAPARTASIVRFGIMGNWSTARFEDYSGGGGAHLVAAHISPNAKVTEGWTNCTLCHNGGRSGSTPYHKMVTPVSSHVSSVHIEVDPQHRFAEGFTIYSGAKQLDAPARNQTGSCSNINCHMSPSPRWSIER